MSEFKVGDWVYAKDWCYGQIVELHDDHAHVEFDTGTGGGTMPFGLEELQPASAPDEVQKTHYDPVAEAYGILLKAYQDPESTTADFTIAIDRALGFLGEALAE